MRFICGKIVPLCLAAVLAICSTASAQGPGQGGLSIDLGNRYTDKAETDGGQSEFSKNTTSFSVSYPLFVDIGVSLARTSFSWEDPAGLHFGNGADDPWDDLYTVGLELKKMGFVSRQLGYIAGINVATMFEQEMDDSLTYGGYLGVMYFLSQKTSVTVGVYGDVSPVEEQIWPLIGLDYNRGAEEGISISLGMPKTEVVYHFSREVAVRTAAGFEGGTYRLSNDSTVAEKGYVQTLDVLGGVYVDLTPAENFFFTVGAEYTLYREFNLFDDEGDDLKKYEPENAVAGYLGLSYTW